MPKSNATSAAADCGVLSRRHASCAESLPSQMRRQIEGKVIDFSARVLHCERHRHP
jgi:hypothetical protein